MSPHDSAATKAAQPADFYDELSQDEQDAHDRIAGLGFTIEQAGRGWKAVKGDESIGPFPELIDLENGIAAFETSDEEPKEAKTLDDFKLTGDSEPIGKTVKVSKQPLLPSTEHAVMQDLRNAVLGYRATTMEILEAQTRQKEEKRLVTALMHKFEDELSTDDETGFKYIQVETVRAVLEITEKEELKTEKVELP